MSQLLNENLQYLMRKQKYIYEKINTYLENSKSSAELYFSSEQFPNLLLYSESQIPILFYDEEETTQKNWLADHSILNEGFRDVVIFGFGLSYHLADLMMLNPDLRFYIYEPRIDIFIEALRIVNIKDVLEHPRVKMFDIGNTKQDFNMFIRYKNLNISNYFYHLVTPQYIAICEKEVKEFLEIDYGITRHTIVRNTFDDTFGALPYRNSIRNLKYVAISQSIDTLKYRFKDCTALVVGAGPSLEHDISTIKKYKDEVLIIAAGSAIQSLLHYGITPHLIASFDPGEINGKVFEEINYHDLPLVFSMQLYTPILERKEKGFFYLNTNSEPINPAILDGMLAPTFTTSPSISGISIQIAYYLGATQVILVGQDVSFPNDSYYSKGAKHIDTSRLNRTIEIADKEIDNVQGGKNKTNESMTLIREGLESIVKTYKQRGSVIYNASSLGAVIEGTIYMPLESILTSKENKKYDFNEIKEIAYNYKPDDKSVQVLKEKLDSKIKYIYDLMQECKKIGKLLSEFEIAARKNENIANSKLLKLEKVSAEITQNKFFEIFIPWWAGGLIQAYDAEIKSVDLEPNMIEKAKLLRKILLPFSEKLLVVFEDIRNELINVNNELEVRENHE